MRKAKCITINLDDSSVKILNKLGIEMLSLYPVEWTQAYLKNSGYKEVDKKIFIQTMHNLLKGEISEIEDYYKATK